MSDMDPARRNPERPGGAAAVHGGVYLVALVGLAAGVGIAVPRLSDGDAGLIAWSGLAVLLLGGAVAGWSAWRLLAGMRRRWWLLALPVLVITAYLALWTVGQGVAASFPAHPALGSRTPDDVGLDYDAVTVPTADGVDLAGWWVPGDRGGAVVLMHGAGSTRSDVLGQAEVVAAGGYGVLLLDARGHGSSGGRGMEFGWYGERDLAAGVDFLVRQPGVATDRIGVVGLSMGGEEAIGAAGVDSRIRAVVAEGATSRVADDKAYLAAYGVRGDLQRGIDRVTYAVAGLLTDAPEPRALRESVIVAQSDGTPTPMLLITAGEVETEGLAADYLRLAAPSAVEVWNVPGAGHTGGLEADRAEWQRRVLGFLDDALARDEPAP